MFEISTAQDVIVVGAVSKVAAYCGLARISSFVVEGRIDINIGNHQDSYSWWALGIHGPVANIS